MRDHATERPDGTRAPTWQRVLTPPAVALAVVCFAALAWICGTAMAGEAHPAVVLLEALPLVPPLLGAVFGARVGRHRGGPTAILWYAALGALLALAVVALLLYGVVAVVAYLFAHSGWRF